MSDEQTDYAEKIILQENQEVTKHEKTEMLIGPEITTKRAWEFFSALLRNLMSVRAQRPFQLS